MSLQLVHRRHALKMLASATALTVLATACGTTPAASPTAAPSQSNATPAPTQKASGATPASKAAASGGPVSLQFWTINLQSHYGKFIQGMLDTFQKDHAGTTIKWVDVPGNQVAPKYLASVGAGIAPDVANMYNVPQFIDMGAVLDLNDYVPADVRAKYGAMWDFGVIGPHSYAIPWYTGFGGGLVYSRKMFTAGGLNPDKPPTTFKDTFAAMEPFKKKSGKFLLSLDTLTPDYTAWEEGVHYLSPDLTKVTFNTPTMLDVVTRNVTTYRAGAIIPEAITATEQAIGWLFGGRAAASDSGPWILNRTTPDVLQQGDFDVSQPLMGARGKLANNPQVFVVSKQSKQPQDAVNLALFVTNAANELAFCKLVAIAPAMPDVANDPYFTQPPKTEPKNIQEKLIQKGREIGIKEIGALEPNAKPTPKWTDLVNAYQTLNLNPWDGSASPKQWIDALQKAWETILAKKS